MLILADENFPLPAVEAMRAAGHDVLWARTDCPGCADAALLERAEAESRLVLALDKDFWQIAVQRREPLERSGVILFRVHPATPESITPAVRRVLGAERGWRGHVSVVTAEGIQMIQAHGRRRDP
jgi:predicted nuclease of predicted toxin-antitoxin system